MAVTGVSARGEAGKVIPFATAYAATNEVAGTGYTAGGATLSGFSATQTGSVARLDFTTPTWANSTITARGVQNPTDEELIALIRAARRKRYANT